jgi:hypothetical protein
MAVGDGLSAVVMSFIRGGPSSAQRAMTRDPTEGFPMTPYGEGRIDLSPRRHGIVAQLTLAMTVP